MTSAQPSALFSGLPTGASSGLAGFESATNYGMFAPAQTPAPIISRLNQETVRILKNSPEVKSRLANAGIETVGITPEQIAIAVKSEMARINKIIQASKIQGRLDSVKSGRRRTPLYCGHGSDHHSYSPWMHGASSVILSRCRNSLRRS